jgi:branched-chain amino acid transport system substrate-binding protein
MEIVVPLYSRLMAKGAGPDNIEGVFGTTEWSWDLTDPGTQAFVKAFEAEYHEPPSQAGHVGYVQTLLYANAVERARTFYPPEVIKALEDFEFEGTGNGKVLYRKADHQAFHDLWVMRGKPKSKMKNEFDLLESVEHVPREAVTYPPTMMAGDLGPYIPAKKA